MTREYEAGSGLTVRTMLAGLRNQAKTAKRCILVKLVGDTYLTVHHWPADEFLRCQCGKVARL